MLSARVTSLKAHKPIPMYTTFKYGNEKRCVINPHSGKLFNDNCFCSKAKLYCAIF